MPLSKDKIRFIVVGAAFVVLLVAAAIIIIEYPQSLSQVFSTPEQPTLQIISRNCIDGRNDSGTNNVNASFTVIIKNVGTSNESKMLVCSVTFQPESGGALTFYNRTLVSLAPGETQTYHPVVDLPDSAMSVKPWNVGTVFE